MPRRNHKPARTCLGCMQRDLKSQMARVAAAGEVVRLDVDARGIGRGGYLHRRQECLQRFARSKVKEFRSLRRRVSLDERLKIAELIRRQVDRNETLE